jgi:trans-L-3-hydroxyproline dehydratase
MWEPRGHADMYGCIVLPPDTPDAHFGVLFLHNEGYSSMCGHGIIAVVTALFETGVLPASLAGQEIRIDAPAGRIVATAEIAAGRVARVRFRNVPSFLALRGAVADVPGVGALRFDLAFGGAFYAYVDATSLGLRLVPDEYRRIIELGSAIKQAVMAQFPVEHPAEPDLSFLYGTIFVAPPQDPANHSRNVCVFADGEVDRSPTGTGVSGRAAIHVARGELGLGQEIRIESLVGSVFGVRAVERLRTGAHEAIVPEVSGSAALTGRSEFWLDPEDNLGGGFLLR